MTRNPLNNFVDAIRMRLDRHRLYGIVVKSLLAMGIGMTAVALIYVVPGYAVPWQAWLIAAGAVMCVGGVTFFLGRHSRDDAAGFADRFFGLKDSVVSCSHFAQSGQQGGFYDLQAEQTEKLIDRSNTEMIRYVVPWKLMSLALMFLTVALALGFKGPSAEVVRKLEIAQATLQNTESANRELKELVDELEKSIDDEEERKLLDPDKLRQWVKELEKTKDVKEALRQYARLEMKLNKLANRFAQRKEETLLDKAAEELQKAEELKELAEKLKRKKYDKAAKDLDELKPEPLTSEDLKKLSEKQKELAKLKAIAKRMAQAARNVSSKSAKPSSQSKNGQKKSNSRESGNSDRQASGQGEFSQGNGQEAANDDLAEMIEDLDGAVDGLAEELEELERWEQEQSGDEFDQYEGYDDYYESEQSVIKRLDRLSRKLSKMARKRSVRSKLRRLSKSSSRSQSQVLGRSMAQGSQRGGREAGEGSIDVPRQQRDQQIDNGQNTTLEGIKGDGPSLTEVEAVDDGTGVGQRRSAATKRKFSRQFESFVEREDVPEDLKDGVKNYFTKIHESEQE